MYVVCFLSYSVFIETTLASDDNIQTEKHSVGDEKITDNPSVASNVELKKDDNGQNLEVLEKKIKDNEKSADENGFKVDNKNDNNEKVVANPNNLPSTPNEGQLNRESALPINTVEKNNDKDIADNTKEQTEKIAEELKKDQSITLNNEVEKNEDTSAKDIKIDNQNDKNNSNDGGKLPSEGISAENNNQDVKNASIGVVNNTSTTTNETLDKKDNDATSSINIADNKKLQETILLEVKNQDNNTQKELETNIAKQKERIENDVKEELKKEEQQEMNIIKSKNLPGIPPISNIAMKPEADIVNDGVGSKEDDNNHNVNDTIILNQNIKDDTSTNATEKIQAQKDDKKNINENKKKADKFENSVDKLFLRFDTKKALDFNYNSIKYDNFSFLENTEELKWIKRTIEEQQDPELRRKREEKEKQKQRQQELREQIKQFERPIERVLRVFSLVYFNDKDWRAKVNSEKVDNKNVSQKGFFGAKPIKANKTSMIFLIQKPDDKITKKVQLIKDNHSSYSGNYYLVPSQGKTYVAFKLFIGQKINLDTMQITG